MDEMSLESLVSRDVQGKSNQESVLTRFRSEEEKDKVRLRVDKRDRSTGEHTVGLSPRIYNSLSRCDGPRDIHHASPL